MNVADLENTELIDFINFPVTDLQAATASRALAFDSGVFLEPTLLINMSMEAFGKDDSVFEHLSEPSKLMSYTSPCPISSQRFPPASPSSQVQCYCQEEVFEVLQEKVESCLSSCSEFDFSYDAAAYMWRGKAICGSRSLEVAVRCFWDRKQRDHLLTIHKVAGDALHLSPNSLLQKVKKSLQLITSENLPRAKMMGPPSAPIACQSSSDVASKELIQCLQQVSTMLRSSILDMHGEVACMFYETIANRTSTLPADVAEENVQKLVIEIVHELIRCQPQEEKEETVFLQHQCVLAVIQLLVQQQTADFLFQSSSLSMCSSLLRLCLVNHAVNKEKAYLTMAMRRMVINILAQHLSSKRVAVSISEKKEMLSLWQHHEDSLDFRLWQDCKQQIISAVLSMQ
jgi:hypothetical protein